MPSRSQLYHPTPAVNTAPLDASRSDSAMFHDISIDQHGRSQGIAHHKSLNVVLPLFRQGMAGDLAQETADLRWSGVQRLGEFLQMK